MEELLAHFVADIVVALAGMAVARLVAWLVQSKVATA